MKKRSQLVFLEDKKAMPKDKDKRNVVDDELEVKDKVPEIKRADSDQDYD